MPSTVGVESDVADLVAVQAVIGRFRYVAALGWHEYVGGCWRRVPRTSHLVHDVVREHIKQRVEELRYQDRPKQASLWKALLTKAHLGALVELVKNMNGILTDPSELDTDRDAVNVRNGIVDLRTGMVHRHHHGRLLTRQAGGDYVPGAASQTWNEILAAVPEDARDWLQLRIGQALSGWTESSLVLLVGGGQNGKSTLMQAVRRAFGDYFTLVSHRVLAKGSVSQHPTELMDLRGARLALLEETAEEGVLDTHQLKTVIGTPQISARRMRSDSVVFDATHSLFVNTNNYPIVPSTDHGTWRRLVCLRFPYKYVLPEPGKELRPGERWADPSLEARIEQDHDLPAAVLAWAMKGALRWRNAQGLLHELPDIVKRHTEEWRAESDVAYAFAKDYLEASPHHVIPTSLMTDRFNDYLAAQRKQPWSSQTVRGRMPGAIEAALGLTVAPRVVNVAVRHLHGGLPFDTAKYPITVGKSARVWEGVRIRGEDEVHPETNGHATHIQLELNP